MPWPTVDCLPLCRPTRARARIKQSREVEVCSLSRCAAGGRAAAFPSFGKPVVTRYLCWCSPSVGRRLRLLPYITIIHYLRQSKQQSAATVGRRCVARHKHQRDDQQPSSVFCRHISRVRCRCRRTNAVTVTLCTGRNNNFIRAIEVQPSTNVVPRGVAVKREIGNAATGSIQAMISVLGA